MLIADDMYVQAYERSEDPIYVLEHNIPIDAQYYLENQISKVSETDCLVLYVSPRALSDEDTTHTLQPLMRIFEPILKNASRELLCGSHTRSISISTPSNSGIMKFAKKQLTCVGCKAVLRYQFHALIYYMYTCIEI